MKNSIYLLLFVITFIACDNGNTQTQEAVPAEQIVEIIKEKSETITEKIVYEFEVEKEDFELTEDFHIMALNGLRMRATPELKGETVLTIPYNAAVKRIDNVDYGNLKIEEIKDFKIKGNWIKIKYDEQIGYVFDGFLTKFPLPNNDKDGVLDYEKYKSSFEYYLRTKIGAASEIYDIRKYSGCEVAKDFDCICYFKQDFGKAVVFSSETCNETGVDYLMIINDISLAEAYFIIKVMDLNGANSTDNKNEQFETVTYDNTEKTINIEVDEAGCYTTIKKVANNKIEIQIYCGC